MALLRKLLVISMLLFASVLSAQPGPAVGGGYVLTTLLKVAPGQVITLFIPGVARDLESLVRASATPLPTTLAGISITLYQRRGTSPIPVPIFAVEPWETCPAGLYLTCTSERLTAVTIQIPYELTPNVPGGSLFARSEAFLAVSENGAEGPGFRVMPVLDRIHILNRCDSAVPFGYRGAVCEPLVTHANGAFVTPSNPARSNEAIVLYAFGLGRPAGEVETGTPTLAPTPVADVGDGLRVRFDFSANAEPSEPLSDSTLAPEYSGLVQGEIGLYQINVRLPQIPVDTPFCTGSVNSNLTVSVGGVGSFDGARLCAEP